MAIYQILINYHRRDDEDPLAGWTDQDCTPLSGDETAARISWAGKGLADLKGQIVRLRFILKDGELYCFDF
jgi:hypothetical protein